MNFTLLFALVLLIIFISSLIRSAFGFGNALIAMPLLVLILGVKTAAPLVALVGIVIALVMLLREWRELDFKAAIYLILSTLAGIPLGLFFLKSTPEHIVKIILGLVLIVFGLYNLFGLRLPPLRKGNLVFPFGFLAGILGGAYNTNGPPVVIYGVMRGWGKERFRANPAGLFPDLKRFNCCWSGNFRTLDPLGAHLLFRVHTSCDFGSFAGELDDP